MIKKRIKGAYRFKTFSLYHCTFETGTHLAVYLQYNLMSKGFGIYQLLMFNGRHIGLFKKFKSARKAKKIKDWLTIKQRNWN